MTATGKTFLGTFGALVLFTALVIATRGRERFRSDRLAVTFFDVGQGDSTLLQFPGGATMMVDAGGGFGELDAGKRDLLRELLRLTILRLDVAFVSHPDQDHAYGFTGLLDELDVRELWVSHVVYRPPRKRLLEELLRLSAVRGVALRTIGSESRFAWGGVEAVILPLEAGKKMNDRSMVLRLDYAGCRVLLTGDSEAAAEAQLARRWRRERAPPLTLLKVAHHGSETSSTEAFLRATRPRWAVVSAGLGNRYGHPRRGAIERLRAAGATVFRTDFHGYVRFTIAATGEIRCETGQGGCGVAQCAAPQSP